MDALDIGILRTMGVRPFARWPRKHSGVWPATIAQALDQHEQTVRDRIARMESDGIIRGYHLWPNLRHVDLDAVSVHWELEKAPDDETLSRLQAVDGVLGALRFYGPHVCFDISHSGGGERDRRLQVVAHLLGEQHEVMWSHDLPFPHVGRELSTLDWRILRARRTDARRPATAVAADVGVTAKTVRTRFDAMREEGSLDEYVSVDFASMTDAVPFILYVWVASDGPDPTARLLERVDEHRLGHFRATVPRSGLLVTQLVASNPADAQRITEAARGIDGVNRAEPQMPTGGFWNEAWLDEIVDANAQVETA